MIIERIMWVLDGLSLYSKIRCWINDNIFDQGIVIWKIREKVFYIS
jgi:hypothetical protein